MKPCDCGAVAVEIHKGSPRCVTCRECENRIEAAHHHAVALRRWRSTHEFLTEWMTEAPDAYHVVGGYAV